MFANDEPFDKAMRCTKRAQNQRQLEAFAIQFRLHCAVRLNFIHFALFRRRWAVE